MGLVIKTSMQLQYQPGEVQDQDQYQPDLVQDYSVKLY